MALIVMRHGEARTDQSGNKVLTEKGRKDVADVAEQLFEAGYEVRLIFHSGKARSAQTAEILAEKIGRSARIEKVGGLNPDDDVFEIAKEINRVQVSLAVIGHMPHVSNLILHMTGVQDTPPFGTAHAVTLNHGEPDWEIEEPFSPGS